jgi:hypothetical protein
MEVKKKWSFFSVMMPYSVVVGYQLLPPLHPEDGSSVVLRKVGALPQHDTARRHNPEDLDFESWYGLIKILVCLFFIYEVVSKSVRTGRLDRELQMV